MWQRRCWLSSKNFFSLVFLHRIIKKNDVYDASNRFSCLLQVGTKKTKNTKDNGLVNVPNEAILSQLLRTKMRTNFPQLWIIGSLMQGNVLPFFDITNFRLYGRLKLKTPLWVFQALNKWYFVTKIVLTYCEKKYYSSDREKLLKFEAEGREFQNFWDH